MITTCIIDTNTTFAELLKDRLSHHGTYEVLYSAAFRRHIDHDIKDILGNIDLLILGVTSEPEFLALTERLINISQAKYNIIFHDITNGYELLHLLSLGINGLIHKTLSYETVIQNIEFSMANKHFICHQTSGYLIGHLQERHKANVLNQLTQKQKQITEGLLRGLSYKEIAILNGISINTVNDYLKRIYKILHISSRSELQARFNKNVNSMYI